jgi:hypothetical protein
MKQYQKRYTWDLHRGERHFLPDSLSSHNLQINLHLENLMRQGLVPKEIVVYQVLTLIHLIQILYCNIGNPQSLSQQPITFFREVGSL